MKRIVLLSAATCLAFVVAACTGDDSNAPPAGDSGTTDSSTPKDSGPDGTAAACMPVTPAAGVVPASYTAPALSQGVCSASDIAAFAAACGGTPAACTTWMQANAASACGQCISPSGTTTFGAFGTITVAGAPAPSPSLGGCILGQKGAAALGCSVAAQPLQACVFNACATCTSAADTAACSTNSESTACASYIGALTSACSKVLPQLISCQMGATAIGTTAELQLAATAICGAPSSDGGTDGGSDGSTGDDGGTGDGGSADGSSGDDGGSSDASGD